MFVVSGYSSEIGTVICGEHLVVLLLIGPREGRVKVVCRYGMQTPGEMNLQVGFFGKCQRFFFSMIHRC